MALEFDKVCNWNDSCDEKVCNLCPCVDEVHEKTWVKLPLLLNT